MPLHDHFHPPLSLRHQWPSMHGPWAANISADLNRRLPPGYFAQANVHIGIEMDVAALRESDVPDAPDGWEAGEPSAILTAAASTDTVEIQVISTREGPILMGAIELVSPANKNRPSERVAFVDKCAALLRRRVGVVIVDVVTERLANLHHALAARLDPDVGPLLDSTLYAASYAASPADGRSRIRVWERPLVLGRPLPTLPLWLRDLCVPVDLETTYERTRHEQRIVLEEDIHATNGAA